MYSTKREHVIGIRGVKNNEEAYKKVLVVPCHLDYCDPAISFFMNFNAIIYWPI